MKKYSGYFLITDLDGTLLNTNKEISPDNQKALAEFTAQGGRAVAGQRRTMVKTAAD